MFLFDLVLIKNAAELADFAPVKRNSVLLRRDCVIRVETRTWKKSIHILIFRFEIGPLSIDLSYFIVTDQESKLIVKEKDDLCFKKTDVN